LNVWHNLFFAAKTLRRKAFILKIKYSLHFLISPDGSENPFVFFLKKTKDCNVQQEVAPKKTCVQKIINVIVEREKFSLGYLFPIIGIECSTFFSENE